MRGHSMKSTYKFSLVLIFSFSLLSPTLIGGEDKTEIEELGETIPISVEHTVNDDGIPTP